MSRHGDSSLGLLLLGGGLGAVGALALRARRHAAPQQPSNSVSGDPPAVAAPAWVHPVPTLSGNRPAVISSGFRAVADAQGRVHLGADVMYRRKDARDLVATFPPGTPGGTPLFFMPDGIPVLAVSAGVVTFAAYTGMGNTVIVRHAGHWATYYTHLSTLAVNKGATVVAGDLLGTIGASPTDPAGVRHLHFELWRGATRTGATDPAPLLAVSSRVVLPSSPAAPASIVASAATHAPRNASLSPYRSVGGRGDPYPAWVRALRDASGVYVIRQIGGPILYVGSSVGRLYDTLTRHLQIWRRYKGFWRGQFAEGADPGLTYDRGSVEVAIKLTAPEDAHDEERRLIRRLAPRDNQIGQPEPEPELEAAPF